jgi:hypothetical protein
MRRKWNVYVIDPKGTAYEWRRCWTRRGAERAAREWTLMPAFLVPMTPIIVHADDLDTFGDAHKIVHVV